MVLDVQLEPVGENAFVCFQGGEPVFVLAPDLDVAAENGMLCRGRNRVQRVLQRSWMRAAIGVYECKNIGSGLADAAVSCVPRAGQGLDGESRVVMSSNDALWQNT